MLEKENKFEKLSSVCSGIFFFTRVLPPQGIKLRTLGLSPETIKKTGLYIIFLGHDFNCCSFWCLLKVCYQGSYLLKMIVPKLSFHLLVFFFFESVRSVGIIIIFFFAIILQSILVDIRLSQYLISLIDGSFNYWNELFMENIEMNYL